MAKIKKTFNEQAQLEAAGVDVSGRNCGTPAVTLFKTNMTELATYMRDLDSQQFINRYKWQGLPKHIPQWRLEQMLYYRGSVVLFKAGKDFYILPYASTKGVNLLGMPNAVIPVSFNGKKPEEDGDKLEKELTINNNGDYNKDAEAVILYDRYNCMINPTGTTARFILSEPIIQEICNRFAYLGINLTNSQGKYLIICKDEKTADVVSLQLDELFSSTKNYALVRSMFEIQVINNKVDYQEQQIWEDISSWNSLRLEGLGVSHNGLFNKKERQINGELSGVKEQTNNILYNGLNARKYFVEQAKLLFGNDPDFKEQFGDDFGVEIAEYLEEEKPTNNIDSVGGEFNGNN